MSATRPSEGEGGQVESPGAGEMRRSLAVARVGSAMALSVVSQLLGLAQLLLLLSDGAGRATDVYFYLLTWSTLPVQVLLVGTYYPLLLRGGRFHRRKEQRWTAAAVVLGVCLVVVGSFLYRAVAGGTAHLPITTAAVALMAASSVPAWLSALKDSAAGNPRWLSAVSLLPSVGALVALAATQDTALGERVAWMVLGQSIGFVSYWVIRRVVSATDPSTDGVREGDTSEKSSSFGSSWLLSQAVIAYGASLWIQTVAASLPDAGLTVLGVTAKVVAAGSTLVSNAILPVVLHRSSTGRRGIVAFAWLVLVLAAAAALCTPWLPDGPVDPVVANLAVLWLASILFNGAMHRIAYRFHHPRLASITIAVSAIVPLGLVLSQTWQDVSLTSVLIALVALDLASGVVFAVVMRLRALALCFSLLPLSVLAIALLN